MADQEKLLTGEEKPEPGFPSRLRAVARVILYIGAGTSLGLVLYAGRTNQHIWLTVLFVIWVLAPFAALIGAAKFAKRWPVQSRAFLYWVMLVVAIASVAIYTNDAIHPRISQRAFVFVIAPAGAWVLTAIGFLIAAVMSRRLSSKT